MSVSLLVDGGGTSVKWFVRNPELGIVAQFRVEGMSPLYLTEDELVEKIREAFPLEAFCQEVLKVEYYGTGCRGSGAVADESCATTRLPQSRYCGRFRHGGRGTCPVAI